MQEKFLQKNFQLVEDLKENVSLMFDKINRRLCIVKKIQNEEIYRQLKKIDNPYTPKIFFVAENFVIEEFIEGENLSEILEREIFSEEKIISILIQLCECLKILHENKIIHRDIKPLNIILNGEKIFLTDFGIAREIKNNLESDTEWLGTRGYAPPEQFGFSQTDCRSDIYSLGVTLKLFQPKSARLQKIIRKATNFNPDDRFQSVDEILAELQGKNLVSRLKNFFVKPKETERKEFEELVKNESLHYQIYIQTQQTARRNSDKKYGFYINEAAVAFFGDILWATGFSAKRATHFAMIFKIRFAKIILRNYIRR